MKPLVIYHGNCADGFTAAWAVRQAMECDFYAGVYSKAPPDVAGRDVIMVDFCYPPAIMRELQQHARSILVLDHHKSAEANLPDADDPAYISGTSPVVWRVDGPDWDGGRNWARVRAEQAADSGRGGCTIYALFDQQRSGAGITWDFFHPGVARPALIDHVEDRDLWRFALHGTREICAAVHSFPFTFEAWDALALETTYALYQQGLVLERARSKDVAEMVALCRRELVICGHSVPVANMPRGLVSEAGHVMAQGQPFAACYYDAEHGRVFSLRSEVHGLDVSEIAAQFPGGGGHARAAGFTVPRDHELARA